ncbi:S-layer homology domain-containing protein [Pseudobacteroides cellulosolvens]|uniref:von Willebrand factor type A n=1 Tax=Pseudobacteroides cellulosolvens ATCC 35603 = DSM 2933 TaxID=398512 RepID=A0A0L6JT62_9FIRM|nr:S-layer homology domain-containing protein [Pseudobacteroides cellulosolvens]KNY28889.1 von Willebrand factor type A [Pseudobacteroides cellulosolvens ATCC 35603 = DSM 2933]
MKSRFFKVLVSSILALVMLIMPLGNCLAASGGSVSGGIINLNVIVMDDTNSSIKYGQTHEDVVKAVKDSFKEASSYLYNATKQQNRFGKITIYVPAAKPGGWPEIAGALPMNNFDPEKSDVYIRPGNGASANVAGFMGAEDAHMYIGIGQAFSQGAKSMGKTLIHEFGHYGYGLGDEYCDYKSNIIDKLLGRNYQVFGKKENNKIVWNKCEESVTFAVYDSAGNTILEVQNGSSYSPVYNSNGRPASIMWVQHDNSIVDFCDSSNHNSSAPNNQNRIHNGKSCWEVMAAKSQFGLTAPGGAITSIGYQEPDFEVRQANRWNDIELVIDRSGSMSGNSITLAKGAAKMYIDLTELPQSGDSGDGIGVVSFSSQSKVEQNLKKITTAADKSSIKSIINKITASGSTNIGGALDSALNDLVSSGYKQGTGAIILLSDGEHNTGTDPTSVIPAIKAQGVPVYTIGIGNVDKNLMNQIAEQTGGEFYYASSVSDINLIYKTIKNKLSIFDRLAKFFKKVFNSLEKSSEIIYVDSTMERARFTISSIDAKKIAFSLKSPDGKIYSSENTYGAEYISEDTYTMYTIDNPVPGAWEVIIENPSDAKAEVVFDLSGKTSIALQGNTDYSSYTYPSPVKVTSLLHKEGKPICNANVSAKVTRPDNSESALSLHDDGLMGDEMPGDGVYTGYFSDFKGDGQYQISITANNENKTAVVGESFIDILPDSTGKIVLPQSEPIDQDFSRTMMLPSISISGTSIEKGLIQLASDCLILDEKTKNVTASVYRLGSNVGTVSVDYSTSDDTAVAGVDYEAAKGTLTFASGETVKNIEIKSLKDKFDTERIKTFNLNLSNPVNSILGVPSSAQINILRTTLSNNADLSGLSVSCGALDKEFSNDVYEYNVSVPYNVDSTTVTSSVYNDYSTVTVNGMNVLSGEPSASINLKPGLNKISVAVKAEDGITEKVYSININKSNSPPANTPTNTPTNTPSSGTSYNYNTSTSTPTATSTPTPTATATGTSTATPTPTPSVTQEPTSKVPQISIPDAKGHWSEPYILELKQKGILDMYEDGTVRPDIQITRAEAVKILIKSLNIKTNKNVNLKFSDSKKIPDWVKEYLAAAQENKIIVGFEDGSFRPDNKMTRSEAATMILKAFKLEESAGKTNFADDNVLPYWAKGFIKKGSELGIINGYENNLFMPQRAITRAELFKIVSKTMKDLQSKNITK